MIYKGQRIKKSRNGMKRLARERMNTMSMHRRKRSEKFYLSRNSKK